MWFPSLEVTYSEDCLIVLKSSDMYTFNEIRLIFARCKDYIELEKVCNGFQLIIKDGDLPQELERYTRMQSLIRFRQLKV